MDPPCALPTPTFPLAHHQHLYGKPRQSLDAWRAVPGEALHSPSHKLDDDDDDDENRPQENGHNHSHSHSQSNGHGHGNGHAHGRSPSRHSPHFSNINTTPRKEKPTVASLKDTPRSARRQSACTPEPSTPRTPYLPPGGHQRHHENHPNDHDHECDHSHDHGHIHSHGDDHSHENSDDRSRFTKTLLSHTARLPILHAILVEKDSRRIFYFMTLNFAFMTVQAFYGYLTDSLGLLSDSIHMFFDCVALLMGLVAAVMSKWPPSQRFPYGFKNVETLSGFANGVLLMLLSVEIAFEAFERLWEGTKTKRLGELLVVSSLGLAINLVGMMALGHHHHHGHNHGHGHSHSHDDDHDHGHGHEHSHDGNDSHLLLQGGKHNDSCGSHGGHGHSHDNENMYGIYLHIMADTLGSVSVIVSTVLTSVWGWSGWDPLASCFIAALIFASAVPLVLSSAKRLLLAVPEGVEYNLRNTLAGIAQQRGVVTYSAPRFWMDDSAGERLRGLVHITAGHGVNLDETRDKVGEYLRKEGISAIVQVERDGDAGCWCVRTRQFSPTAKTPEPF